MTDFSTAITSVDALTGLLALASMEIMLGVDNVIFVSIVLGKLKDIKDRKKASRIWMIVGIIMRILLLFSLAALIKLVGEFKIFGHTTTLKDIVMIGGGLFLLISTTLEIHNKLEGENPNEKANDSKGGTSFASVLGQILLIDVVFSFDSIITAFGLVSDEKIGNPDATFVIRAIAVFIAMFIMFKFAPKISNFIHKHPTFKMLAMSMLMLIGVTLLAEGVGFHIPHGYIYFAMAFSFCVELLNMQIRKKSKPVELREPTPTAQSEENLL
jgi:predicted tellurium resistance membrane protein TerC